MKFIPNLPAALAAATIVVSAAFSAATSPAGLWRWIIDGPNGKVETTLKLEAKDGKLAGLYSNKNGNAPTANVTFKDGILAFDVERDFNGRTITLHYRGRLEGDTIKGTIEAANASLGWHATRGK